MRTAVKKHEVKKKAQTQVVKRKGFAMMSLILAIAVVAIILMGVYAAYRKVTTSQKIQGATSKVTMVIGVIENSKGANGGAYPAVSGAIASTSPFSYYLGTNKNDVLGINYSCAAGTSSTITVTFPTSLTETNEICQAVAAQIQTNTGWTASCTGAQLTIKKTPVICQ